MIESIFIITRLRLSFTLNSHLFKRPYINDVLRVENCVATINEPYYIPTIMFQWGGS